MLCVAVRWNSASIKGNDRIPGGWDFTPELSRGLRFTWIMSTQYPRSTDLSLQLFLLYLILLFVFAKHKRRKHKINSCIISDLHANLGFVCKSFSKTANWPSLCMMLKCSNEVLGIAQLTLELLLQEWELGPAWENYFPELLMFLFEFPFKENPWFNVFLYVRVCRFSLILGLFVCLFFNISYLFMEVQGRLTHSWRAARSYLFWIMYSLQLSWEKIFLENVMFVQYRTQTWKRKYCSSAWCMGTPSGLCVILGAGFRSGTLFKWDLGFLLRLPY